MPAIPRHVSNKVVLWSNNLLNTFISYNIITNHMKSYVNKFVVDDC